MFDSFAECRKSTGNVIPAKAGIQKYIELLQYHWTPVPVPDLIRDSPG